MKLSFYIKAKILDINKSLFTGFGGENKRRFKQPQDQGRRLFYKRKV